jgi:hypothetical protein
MIEKPFGEIVRQIRRLKYLMDYRGRFFDLLGAVFVPLLAIDLITGDPVIGGASDR